MAHVRWQAGWVISPPAFGWWASGIASLETLPVSRCCACCDWARAPPWNSPGWPKPSRRLARAAGAALGFRWPRSRPGCARCSRVRASRRAAKAKPPWSFCRWHSCSAGPLLPRSCPGATKRTSIRAPSRPATGPLLSARRWACLLGKTCHRPPSGPGRPRSRCQSSTCCGARRIAASRCCRVPGCSRCRHRRRQTRVCSVC